MIELTDGTDSLMFDSSSSELKPAAVSFLKQLAPLLATVENKIEIHGHTDARPFDPRSKTNNWDLSYERARAARQILEANGLPSNKINGLLAHGDSMLHDPEHPYSPQNRRLAILVVRKDFRAPDAGDGAETEAAPAEGEQPQGEHTEEHHEGEHAEDSHEGEH